MVKVINIEGDVYVKLFGETSFNKIESETLLNEYDEIKTSEKGSCDIEYSDGSVVMLDYDTTIKVRDMKKYSNESSSTVLISIIKGTIVSKVTKRDSKFEVETTNAVAGVRGTEFMVIKVSDTETKVVVIEGEVYSYNEKDRLEMDNQISKAKSSGASLASSNRLGIGRKSEEILVKDDQNIMVNKIDLLQYLFRNTVLEQYMNNYKIHQKKKIIIDNK
jgi:hypothetical protein